MCSRLLAPVAAVLFLVGSASADSVTYDLVIDVPGSVFGSTLSGSFTFPSAFLGATSFPATSISDFDITVEGYSPPGPGWHFGDVFGGNFYFLEPIGSPFLTPAGDTFVFTANQFAPSTPSVLYLYVYSSTSIVFPNTSVWYWFGFDDATLFGDYASTDLPAPAWHLALSSPAPLPEPGTLLLIALGGGVLGWHRRRRVVKRA